MGYDEFMNMPFRFFVIYLNFNLNFLLYFEMRLVSPMDSRLQHGASVRWAHL
jgi:hypothetical protein